VKIGIDVRPKSKIEEGNSYELDVADILSPSVKELAFSATAALILYRRSRPAFFLNEVAMLHKFQSNEGIPLVRAYLDLMAKVFGNRLLSTYFEPTIPLELFFSYWAIRNLHRQL
jgi:hypothetical protein